MRKLILLLIPGFICFYASSQTSADIDSLIRVAEGQKDSARYATLMKVGHMYNRKGLSDSALYYHSMILQYAQKSGSQKQLCGAYLAVAGTQIRKSQFDKALENLFAGLKIAEKEGYNEYIGRAKTDIGYIYYGQRKLKESLRFLFQAEQTLLDVKDTMSLISLYSQLVVNVGLDGDTLKGMEYYHKAISLGDAYEASNTFPPGKIEFLTGLRLGLTYSMVNFLTDQQDMQKALENLLVIKEKTDARQNNYQKFQVRCILANLYLRLKQHEKALSAGEEAVGMYKLAGSAGYNQLRDLYWIIASSSSFLKDYKKAYDNMELVSQYNDSLFNRDKLEAIQSVEARYETEKKEQKIASLNKEKKNERIILLITIAGLAVVLGLFVFAIRANRLQKKLFAREKEAQRMELERRMAELEQTALRAQMNPHFIFNCLNSVQRYVINKDVAGVNQYLSTFASLIRQTLENSGKQLVPLDSEIKYLDTYLRMEQMRSNDRFSYAIDVDPLIVTSDISIPGMIIQPFVENSIQHGARGTKEKEGYINLTISKNGSLLVRVEDNGPGINAFNEARIGDSMEHESMGLAITEKRIEVYNSLHDENIQLRITDKSETGANGTVIQLEFPLTNES